MIINKFGGEIMANTHLAQMAVNHLKRQWQKKQRPVVVVSAFKGVTDELALIVSRLSKHRQKNGLISTINSIMKTAGAYKITRQGQITLPAEAREKIGLKEGDMVEMFYGGGLVLMKKKKEPLQVFEELATTASKRFKEKRITPAVVAREIETARKGR